MWARVNSRESRWPGIRCAAPPLRKTPQKARALGNYTQTSMRVEFLFLNNTTSRSTHTRRPAQTRAQPISRAPDQISLQRSTFLFLPVQVFIFKSGKGKVTGSPHTFRSPVAATHVKSIFPTPQNSCFSFGPVIFVELCFFWLLLSVEFLALKKLVLYCFRLRLATLLMRRLVGRQNIVITTGWPGSGRRTCAALSERDCV